MRNCGIVVIGRNEAENLQTCLKSIPLGIPIVYSDSQSTDGSAEIAERFGATVVQMVSHEIASAARARNLGFGRLMQLQPELQFVQFVDGDCELDPAWLNVAIAT